MRRAALVVALVLVALWCVGCGGPKPKFTEEVASVSVEDANHVAVVVAFANTGTVAANGTCPIVAYDGGGTQVGVASDGPADNVPAGTTVTIRTLIKTDTDSSTVSDVKVDSASCDFSS